MKFYKIDQYFEFTFQTQKFDTGVATDADALPTWRCYEENNDTVISNDNCAKRDDTNTTGYYYARGQCTVAAGFEVGKTYEVRAAATVNSVAGAAVIGRFTMLPALVWDSLYGGTDNLQVDTIQLSGTTQTAHDVGGTVNTNLDATVSSRSSHSAADVWSAVTRTLSAFGFTNINTDISTTVSTNLDTTVSSRSSHAAADIWSVATRELTGFGTLVTSIWGAATRTLSAFGFTSINTDISTTVTTNLDTTVSSRATPAQVLTQVDAALDAAGTELTSVPTGTGSLRQKLNAIFQYLIFRRWTTATTETLYKQDGATALGTSTVSDDGTTAKHDRVS